MKIITPGIFSRTATILIQKKASQFLQLSYKGICKVKFQLCFQFKTVVYWMMVHGATHLPQCVLDFFLGRILQSLIWLCPLYLIIFSLLHRKTVLWWLLWKQLWALQADTTWGLQLFAQQPCPEVTFCSHFQVRSLTIWRANPPHAFILHKHFPTEF